MNHFRTNERGKNINELKRGNQQQLKFGPGQRTMKSNAAMVSSKPPSVGSIGSLFKPERQKRPTESINIPTPVKKRARSQDLESDEDIKLEERPYFSRPVKKISNPFKPVKKERTLKKDGVYFEIDDTEDFKETPRLVLKKPKKKQETKTTKELQEELQEEREKEQLLNSLKRAQKKLENEADKKKCPYCAEILYPMNNVIANALKEIEKKDELHRKAEVKALEKESSTSIFSSSTNMIRKRQVPWSEKDAFCKLHNIELIIKPDGENEGYPTTINFDDIERRVRNYDEPLKDVIRNKIMSDYRDIAEQAYKDEGITKARSSLSVMNRFQKSLPGYYGPKGAAVILNVLSKMYLKTGYLEKHLVSQQLPLEFLQQVLVPEAGFRLILEDLLKGKKKPIINSKEKAKKIMLESIEYGSAIFPCEDAKIDDGKIKNPVKFPELEDPEEDDPFQSD